MVHVPSSKKLVITLNISKYKLKDISDVQKDISEKS